MRELKGDWRDLFNGFMVALDLRKCFLALCGIVVTICLCGGMTITLGNHLDPDSVVVPRDLVLHKWLRAQNQAWHVIYKGPVPKAGAATKSLDGGAAKPDMMAAKPGAPAEPKANAWLALGYSIVFGLIFVAIWSYFGGAIARIAAYEIAKDGERIETRKALQFSRKKFWSFFWAPLICAIGLLFFGLCNYVGGFVGKLLDFVYIGAPMVAILLPLALLSGFIMTLILVGTFTGAPLFAPAVAAEGTDSFDAVSRGFSYVYSRPWHYIWYQMVASVYGYICIGFVILFAIAMCHVGIKAGEKGFELCGAWKSETKSSFSDVTNAAWKLILSDEHQHGSMYRWDPVGIVKGPHPYGRLQVLSNKIVRVDYEHKTLSGKDLSGDHMFAAFVLTLWLAITLGLALGYVVSYFISQQTMIYYILRKKVDGIEMNEVFEEAEEEAKAMEVGKPAEPGKPAESAAPAGGGEPPKPSEPPKEEKK
jgi:MFS family permease